MGSGGGGVVAEPGKNKCVDSAINNFGSVDSIKRSNSTDFSVDWASLGLFHLNFLNNRIERVNTWQLGSGTVDIIMQKWVLLPNR